jgi:outer membrane protein assembly factor BamB
LRSCKLIHEEKTPSSFAFKGWGASDASPIFTGDAKFIWPSESGVVYFGQVTSNGVNQLSQARYRITNPSRQGIESSPSAIANLVYMADNGGTVFCLDVRTMKPRWHYTTGDDNDATPVVEVINGVPYVYIGNEVDMQGKRGTASFSKLNGLTGQLIWKYSRKCNSEFGKKPNSGGILSTCCIGKGKIESYVWTVFSRVDSMLSGKLVCINKETGKLKYEINMRQYSWVSPILLYDRLGNAYLYLSDVGGNVYLILAETGEILYKKNIGMTFESSPIAWNNFIIQPARGNQVLCFQLE